MEINLGSFSLELIALASMDIRNLSWLDSTCCLVVCVHEWLLRILKSDF